MRHKRKRFDSINCKQETNTTVFWTLVRKLLDQSIEALTDRLYAFAEASSDIDANVNHDAILQYSDARS